MVKYDSQVIVTFAEKLYRQASSTPATFAVLGGLVGLPIGAGAGSALGLGALVGAVIGALVVGAVAFVAGKQRVSIFRGMGPWLFRSIPPWGPRRVTCPS